MCCRWLHCSLRLSHDSHMTTHIEVSEVLVVVQGIPYNKLVGDLKANVCKREVKQVFLVCSVHTHSLVYSHCCEEFSSPAS